jgi:thioredoxin-related protein
MSSFSPYRLVVPVITVLCHFSDVMGVLCLTYIHTGAIEERIKHFTELNCIRNVLLMFHNGGCFYCDVVKIDLLAIKK